MDRNANNETANNDIVIITGSICEIDLFMKLYGIKSRGYTAKKEALWTKYIAPPFPDMHQIVTV
jgi:hypothetical protein